MGRDAGLEMRDRRPAAAPRVSVGTLDWRSCRAYVGAMRPAWLLLVAVSLAGAASGQPRTAPPLPDSTAGRYGSSAALVITLSEYGLGAGGALRARVADDWSLTAELGAGAGRDEREQSFGGGLFGERVTPFKRNNVLLVPLEVGLERRLFRRAVEDNVRPFVAVAVGPTLAYQWPYFDDLDGDGRRDDGEPLASGLAGFGDGQARVGAGATVAVGAAFGRSVRTAPSVRFGVRGAYFPTAVDLLEITPLVDDPSRQVFVTPVVSFHVARLL